MIVFARPVPEMIDGAPKRPPGERSDDLHDAPRAARPGDPREQAGAVGADGEARDERDVVDRDRARGAERRPVGRAERDREPHAARRRIEARLKQRRDRALRVRHDLRSSRPGASRSPPNAAAPGASVAPRAPVVAPLPMPSWKRQSATRAPSPLEAASRPMMKVCGAETVVGAVHVAAVAGTAAASEAAAVATAAARAGCGRMQRQRSQGRKVAVDEKQRRALDEGPAARGLNVPPRRPAALVFRPAAPCGW